MLTCYLPYVTEQRRDPERVITVHEATGSTVLDDLRASDAPLVEYVRAGGFAGFSPEEIFA